MVLNKVNTNDSSLPLESAKFFNSLSKKQQNTLLKLVSIKHYKNGEVIFREKEQPDYIYFIKSGSANVLQSKDMIKIASLGEGDDFGAMSLVDNSLRSATIIAGTNLHTYRIAIKDVKKLSVSDKKEEREIYNSFMKSLFNAQTRHLQDTNKGVISAITRKLEYTKKLSALQFTMIVLIVMISSYQRVFYELCH